MTIKVSKKLPIILGIIILLLTAAVFAGSRIANASEARTAVVREESNALASGSVTSSEEELVNETANAAEATGTKALAAAIAVGLAAAAGAIAMGIAIAKSAEGISRQPEAEGSIRTTLMLGLVFIETAIIYALIVAILIIFVM